MAKPIVVYRAILKAYLWVDDICAGPVKIELEKDSTNRVWLNEVANRERETISAVRFNSSNLKIEVRKCLCRVFYISQNDNNEDIGKVASILLEEVFSDEVYVNDDEPELSKE